MSWWAKRQDPLAATARVQRQDAERRSGDALAEQQRTERREHERARWSEYQRRVNAIAARLGKPYRSVDSALRQGRIVEPSGYDGLFSRLAALEEHGFLDGLELRMDTWRDAEAAVARWMRLNGYPDAHTTGPGTDGGVDVKAKGAVAQVKWRSNRVGRPAVQQRRGAAGTRRAFMAAKDVEGGPFTHEAYAWAKSNRVTLLVVDALGGVRQV